MNEMDAAKELWEHRNDPDEWSEEVEDIEVKPRRSSVLSFRLPPEELDALEQALEQSGESLSEYIRKALTMRLREESSKSRIEVTFGNPGHPDHIVLNRGTKVFISYNTQASYRPRASTDRVLFAGPVAPDKMLAFG